VEVDTKLAQNLFKLDKEPHITIDQRVCATVCRNRACIAVCPADLYEINENREVIVNWEGCLECGACMICCNNGALSWSYPRGGFGVQYRMS
jgi:ferredoxin like protein